MKKLFALTLILMLCSVTLMAQYSYESMYAAKEHQDNLVFMFIGFVVFWFITAFIVSTFGVNRKIGVWGTFFSSLFLSPILAMLFVLASDKLSDDEIAQKNAKKNQFGN
jgi:hypothetical protein